MHRARMQSYVAHKRRQDKAQDQYGNVFVHAKQDGRGRSIGTDSYKVAEKWTPTVPVIVQIRAVCALYVQVDRMARFRSVSGKV